MPTRKPSGETDAVAALRAAPPAERPVIAAGIVARSRDLEALRPALAALAEAADTAHRPLLHEKYAWCEASATRRDFSGFIRAGIVRALQPIIQPVDEPILLRALVTYQQQGLYELCAELRAAALRAMGDLHPDTAALFAARFLRDPLTSFSGEPALTAARLLAAQGRLEPLFEVASWGGVPSEVLAEALRNLTALRPELVDLLVGAHAGAADAQVAVGLLDLLLGHPERLRWQREILAYVRADQDPGVYGIAITSIVASRDPALVEALREVAARERDPARRRELDDALALA